MKTERELFVKKYREVFKVDKSLFVNQEGKFIDEFCQSVYEIWQASASRKGYKLVPCEPTKEMLIAADNCVIDGKVTSNNIYKAMIGAVP